MESRKVITKPTLEEDKSHGTHGFPFQIYRENYRQYPMGVMDLHWHRELELEPRFLKREIRRVFWKKETGFL